MESAAARRDPSQWIRTVPVCGERASCGLTCRALNAIKKKKKKTCGLELTEEADMGKFSPCWRAYMFRLLSYICVYALFYDCFKRGLLRGPLALLPPPRSTENVSPRLSPTEKMFRVKYGRFLTRALVFFFPFLFFRSPPYLRCSIPSPEGWRNVT